MPGETRRGASSRIRPIRRWKRWFGVISLLMAPVLAAVVLVPSGSEGASTPTSVNVLYAGSLLDLMVKHLAPAFQRVSGDHVVGFPGGSLALASEIKGGIEVGDVLISASPIADWRLHGATNGNWVTSYIKFGASPLVLGYRQSSRFASQLARKPWYTVVTRPGFILGRTDPVTDPKGRLALTALDEAAARFHRPALAALAHSASNIYPETTLVGRLQSGQLDAGFFYAVEAKASHLRTVPLVGVSLRGVFTVAVLRGAPHVAAARAFVAFLLGRHGRKILAADGIVPFKDPVRVRSFAMTSAVGAVATP